MVEVNDEVSCTYPGCHGHTFVVARVCEANNCGSGYMVAAYLKGSPDREIKGIVINKINYGIDMSYFKKIENELPGTTEVPQQQPLLSEGDNESGDG